MIKAVIIDDEQHSIETLKWKLENYCPEVEVMIAFDNPYKGVEYVKQKPTKLPFLEIRVFSIGYYLSYCLTQRSVENNNYFELKSSNFSF